ncbi:valyl-trna synthetase [hydrocarbon metagenome]|uniref:valine--tRNA ligase n=1 Tax=hydrocarbon metagenome TaxID=938273 RepID=A0A0W8E2V3_9ZZZZ
MGTAKNLPTVYDPGEVERKWYQYWKDNGYFTPEPDYSKQMFSIVMPPPNVTGALHLGHALDNTIQDILTRWHRMQGHNTLWLPGTDHAGIATQARVEESLARQGIGKYDLGREQFLEKVWEWKHLYGSTITDQLSLLGSSCDWSRERFTMDEGCSKAVREVFVNLYEKGLIYRGNYLVNWCPKCHTAISDIEVEHEDHDGHLWHIKYPVLSSEEYLVVATTRPETMLGDTGVAVHPDDERYSHLIGKKVLLPLINREIPVFVDSYVDPEFGTGAVKVTPAHDPNDFEMGLRHDLEQVVVMDSHGNMNENAGSYQGMSREEARSRIVKDLEQQGLLLKVSDHSHAVGHCQRCATIIEPMISMQWFVKMKPLAEPAIQKVLDGEIRFVPERFTKIYINWMENIRDWCISRQLWWGHRIPVWYCQDCGEVICSRIDPEKCSACESSHLIQDEDVLDTWFSSALWPFSTLGWPDTTKDMEYYYPTSVLVTGRDIIFFWVARMIFSGIEQTGQVPFGDVNIHGLILDGQGRKMSKSLGNGIDPIEVIDKYGADTLRFSMITGVTPGNDVRFNWEKVENTRNFANKIWNASRFAMMNLQGYQKIDVSDEELQLVDRWILSRLNLMVQEVSSHLQKYDLGEAARELYEFIRDEFCDWYIELAKPRLFNPGDEREKLVVQNILKDVLQTILRTLHPFMPFITEEIYQNLPGNDQSIMIDPWPEADSKRIWPEAVEQMKQIMNAIRSIRNIRAEFNIPPGSPIEALILLPDEGLRQVFLNNDSYLAQMANVGKLEVVEQLDSQLEQAVSAVSSLMEIYVPLEGIIDFEKEIARLNKELKNVQSDLDRSEAKLQNESFLSRAPEEVIAKEKFKVDEAKTKKEGILQRLQIFSEK